MFKQENTDFHPSVSGSILFFGTWTLLIIIWPVGLIFKLVLFFIYEVLSPLVSLSKMNPDTSFFSFDKNGVALKTHSKILHGTSKVYSVNESNWNIFTEKDKDWIKLVSDENLKTYILKQDEDLVGYFELIFNQNECEIAYLEF